MIPSSEKSLNNLPGIGNTRTMAISFYSWFVCTSAYANVYFKTTIIKENIKIILIAGVPSSQALPGCFITAPPSVCVLDVIDVLSVWILK